MNLELKETIKTFVKLSNWPKHPITTYHENVHFENAEKGRNLLASPLANESGTKAISDGAFL